MPSAPVKNPLFVIRVSPNPLRTSAGLVVRQHVRQLRMHPAALGCDADTDKLVPVERDATQPFLLGDCIVQRAGHDDSFRRERSPEQLADQLLGQVNA